MIGWHLLRSQIPTSECSFFAQNFGTRLFGNRLTLVRLFRPESDQSVSHRVHKVERRRGLAIRQSEGQASGVQGSPVEGRMSATPQPLSEASYVDLKLASTLLRDERL